MAVYVEHNTPIKILEKPTINKLISIKIVIYYKNMFV